MLKTCIMIPASQILSCSVRQQLTRPHKSLLYLFLPLTPTLPLSTRLSLLHPRSMKPPTYQHLDVTPPPPPACPPLFLLCHFSPPTAHSSQAAAEKKTWNNLVQTLNTERFQETILKNTIIWICSLTCTSFKHVFFQKQVESVHTLFKEWKQHFLIRVQHQVCETGISIWSVH